MTKEINPYDGTMIFKPVEAVKILMDKAATKRADKTDPMADHYAKPEVYQGLYKQAIKRLSGADMISVTEAARQMKLTPDDYLALADKGAALLITMGKRQFVPAWSITKEGKVDPLKCDIAREFVLEGQGFFKFLDYLKFMTEEKADIAAYVAPQTLSMIFYTAGLSAFDCSLSVKATMNQLADLQDKESFYREALIRHLNAAVTHGGWDSSGGLSRPFRDRHNVPGLTMDEERSAPQP